MSKKRLLAGLLIIGLMCGLAVAEAQEMKFFRIGTGGTAGTYYPIGGIIANAISNPPGSRPCEKGGSCGVPGLVAIAQSANGSVANVNAIKSGALEAGFAQQFHATGNLRVNLQFAITALAVVRGQSILYFQAGETPLVTVFRSHSSCDVINVLTPVAVFRKVDVFPAQFQVA